jgi:hypothetical protein
MTQALNLANFANNLNTSGATSNAGLQNSSVTVTAGTAMSGGGAVSLGGSVTLNNAGVTSIVAGTGISISGATGAVTVTSTVSGGVSSVNGATGAVVTTGLYNIGMTVLGRPQDTTDYTTGSTIAGSSLYLQPMVNSYWYSPNNQWQGNGGAAAATLINTGSWRCINRAFYNSGDGASYTGLWVRYA